MDDRPPLKYRFVTFNVCGIKNLLSRCAQWVPERSYSCMFEKLGADVVCFQETKVQPDGIDKEMAIVPGFASYFSCSTKPRGYSGVAFYVRNSMRVLNAEEGLTGWLTSTPGGTPYREKQTNLGAAIYPDISERDGLAIDVQGRSITLDLGACVIIGLYCPADSSGNMSDYRELFFQLLDWRVTQLRTAGREIVVLGDLNVAREPVDSATLREALRKAKEPIDSDTWKYGSVSRKAVNDWVEKGEFADTTRDAHPHNNTMFTCWDQSKNARPANFGSRIDYVLASSKIKCLDANIMPELMGSDHCPVFADLLIDGMEPQGAHRLPALSRKYTSKWLGGVKAFFNAQPSKHSTGKDVPGSPTPEAGFRSRKHGEPSERTSPAAAARSITSERAEQHTLNEAKGNKTNANLEGNELQNTSTNSTEGLPTLNNGAAPGLRPESTCDAAEPSSAPHRPPPSSENLQRSSSDDAPTSVHAKAPAKAPTVVRASAPAKAAAKTLSAGVTKQPASSRQASISKFFATKSTDWARVSEKKPPLCSHNEPCKLKMSRKPPRKGEYFWSCARPHGGTSNADGKFQCKTFIWDSELK